MIVHTERIIRSTVPGEYQGWRIDRYLADRFSYQSRSRWQKEITGGRIRRNGEMIGSPGIRVAADDVVEYDPADRTEPAVDFSYAIIHEDDRTIAVNKTGNLPVHPSGRFFHHTLLMHLQENIGRKLYTVHRLDRETSGAILFAKSAETASLLQESLKGAKKTYIAVVRGTPAEEKFKIDMPIGQDRTSRISKKRAAYADADEPAETRFTLLASTGEYSLLRAVLGTGRLHQIRVHLEYAGYPILGDKLYGGNEELYLEFVRNGFTERIGKELGFHRTALHARSIEFMHPANGKRTFIEAPLPDDMKELVRGMFGNLVMDRI